MNFSSTRRGQDVWIPKPCSFSQWANSLDLKGWSEDLLIEILICLPVRSLVRCRCVSKSWYSLITSPAFIKIHLERHRNRRILLIRRCFRPPRNTDLLSFHDPDSPNLEKLQPNLPIPFLRDITCSIDGIVRPYIKARVNVLGPINGLICIAYNECMMLCNPALREFKQLPVCPNDYPNIIYAVNFVGHGFGSTDNSGGNFKVVLIRSFHFQNVTSAFFYVYDSRLKSWKKIDYDPEVLSNKYYHPFSHIFFNGACHWHANFYVESLPHFIISLDINTEVIRRLEYPDWVVGHSEIFSGIMVLNECIAMIRHPEGLITGKIEVWMMKEYGVKESWSKQLIISQRDMWLFLPWRNDEWLLGEIGGQLISYASYPSRMMRYKIYGINNTLRPRMYEESLISVNQL